MSYRYVWHKYLIIIFLFLKSNLVGQKLNALILRFHLKQKVQASYQGNCIEDGSDQGGVWDFYKRCIH